MQVTRAVRGAPPMKRRLLFVVAVLLSVNSTSAAELPTEHTIGQIEAVFEFRGAMPTGVSVAPNLRDEKFRVEFVHVGLRVQSRPGPHDPSLRFFNLGAEYYQRLADLLQREALDGLRDATTIGQLAGIRYELDASGRIKIESKDS